MTRIPLVSTLMMVGSLIALPAYAGGTHAQPQHYSVTDLGQGFATDMDPGTGRISGARRVEGNDIAWRLGSESEDRELGLLPEGLFSVANSIRRQDDGSAQLVGTSGTGPFSLFTHPFVVTLQDGDPTLTLVDLGTAGDFSLSAFATSVTRAGMVCGYADSPDQTAIEPGCWPSGPGSFQALPTLGGPDGFIQRVNAGGDRCGNTETASGDTHATCWLGDDPPVDLQEGVEATLSFALAINDNRKVGGFILTAEGVRGFTWTPDGGLELVTPLPGDTTGSVRAINNLGVAVGESGHGDEEQQRRIRVPVIVDSRGQSQSLLDRLDESTIADGCELQSAVGIADDGGIVVNGQCDGGSHVWLLTPDEVPPHHGKGGKKRHPKPDVLHEVAAALQRCGLSQDLMTHLSMVNPTLAHKLWTQTSRAQ